MKRTILVAVLLITCILSATVGGTVAWFTDEVESGINQITAGDLDIELYNGNGKVESTTKLFTVPGLWEPGAVAVENLTIKNEGSLALKYQMAINTGNENTVDGNGLSTALKVGIKDGAIDTTNGDRAAIVKEITNWTSFADFTANGTLLPEGSSLNVSGADTGSKTYGVVIYWEPTAEDNKWNVNNGKEVSDFAETGKNYLQIDLGVKLEATQLVAEDDSFGPDYDAGAHVSTVASIAELKSAIEMAENGDVIVFGGDIQDADGILITDKNITIDLNGKTFTTSEGASTNNRNFKITGNSKVTIKNGTLIANGDLTSGAYGTIRTEDTANVTLDNVKLYSYRGYGLNVKANTGTTVTINNSEIYAQHGGGVEAAGGTIELNNTKIEQKGVDSRAAWCSVAIGVNGEGKVTVNSGTYSAETIATDSNAAQGTWVAYVMSSGGTLEINGGTFNGKVAETAAAANACGIICADKAAVVDIYGGTFKSNGAILDMRNNVGTLPNPVATLYGGTFSADPTVSGLYSSNLIKVADGYAATQNSDGTWTVVVVPNILTPETYSTTTIASNKTYSLSGDFDGKNVSLVMAEGVKNVVFDGSNASNIKELIIIQNGKLIDNAATPIGERSGKVTVQKFDVLSQINVFACKTDVEVCNNTAEALMIYAGNCAVNVHHNTIDANFESHPTYRDENNTWNTNNYGIALNIFDYNLWLDNNTVTDATGHAIGINGWETTIDNGDENVIESFKGNKITVNSTANTKRAAFKVWDDETYASNDDDTNVVNATAQAFINAVLADGSNTFNIIDGYDHTIFCFYNVNTNN